MTHDQTLVLEAGLKWLGVCLVALAVELVIIRVLHATRAPLRATQRVSRSNAVVTITRHAAIATSLGWLPAAAWASVGVRHLEDVWLPFLVALWGVAWAILIGIVAVIISARGARRRPGVTIALCVVAFGATALRLLAGE